MKRILIYFITIIILVSSYTYSSASGFSQNADAIEKAADSVLLIAGIYEDDSDYMISQGSGFIAFNSSTMITNYHVIEGLTNVYAWDDEDDDYEHGYEIKYVLCADKEADIAILEFAYPTQLKPLELYPDDSLKRGSPVVAIGSPGGGSKNTVSAGIISSQYMNEKGLPGIQTTAAISHGSSGGALFNDDGKVIGVTSATSAVENTQNINFAVNIAVAQAMYDAWDGVRYTLENHKESAKMDFSRVYIHSQTSIDHSSDGHAESEEQAGATWTCQNCGSINSDRFCQECGSEKPSWICSCGKVNSGKFCGSCGKKAEDLVYEFNQAIQSIDEHRFEEACSILEELGHYDSGSFETNKGTHANARAFIPEVYYEYGIYLISAEGDHDKILECFTKAGDYRDAREQIIAENKRYAEAFYLNGIELLNKGEYLAAIECFKKVEDYSDAKNQIENATYLYGVSLLEKKEYKSGREVLMGLGSYKDSETLMQRSFFEEGLDAYDNEKYLDAIDLFAIAGSYPEADSYIPKCYYALGCAAMQIEEYEKATYYFSQAGSYNDSNKMVAEAKEKNRASIYENAIQLFEQGKYEDAEGLFKTILNYRNAEQYVVKCSVGKIRKKYEFSQGKGTKEIKYYRDLLSELDDYGNLSEAIELKKEIEYTLGTLYLGTHDYKEAIDSFVEAGEFSDSAEKLLETAKVYYEILLERHDYKAASKLAHERLIPYGYAQDPILMKQGDNGEVPAYILNLIRVMEIDRNIPKDEKVYREQYESSVQKFEEHFDLTPDGAITMDEYVLVNDSIYKGATGNKAKKLIEKLCDLSYLRNLAENHSTYINAYYNGVKDAEKAFGLKVDGVVTPEEYNIIMSKKVELKKPENVKVQVSKDTVTISWSRVPGAIKYTIYSFEDKSTGGKIQFGEQKKVGETKENRWIHKNVETGKDFYYIVEATKYTVQKKSDPTLAHIPIYYKPVNVADLNKQLNIYKGKTVSLKGLRVDNISINMGNKYDNSRSAIKKAQTEYGIDVYLLCHSGSNYVEILLVNYKSWDWGSYTDDLLGEWEKITSISVEGRIENEVGSWGEIKNVPTINADSITRWTR